MGKIGHEKFTGTGTKQQGVMPAIATGKLTAGGGKLGTGKKLKAMMVWHDKGARSPYK